MFLENKMINSTILVTGAAGFIGFHLCVKLIENGHNVVGVDNINDYYDINLKYARLKELGITRAEAEKEQNLCISEKFGSKMNFVRMNIEDQIQLPLLFQKFKFTVVCNLAAQAGVRYSIENPIVYITSNINGFMNVLECCRNFEVKRFVYASSSSVYGNSDQVLLKETANVDYPISLYAATKKSNELMAYTYSHLFNLKAVGLRFFTVYGPWGRPDMAMYLFTDAILKNKPINIFNNGELYRDFTYIDDIVDGIFGILNYTESSKLKNEVFNVGNNNPIKLLDFVDAIENETGIRSIKNMMPMQPGDVNRTCADITEITKAINYNPKISVSHGIREYIKWFKKYYVQIVSDNC